MSIESLRTVVLAEATEDTARVVRAAEADRRKRLAEAQRSADAIVAAGRSAGEADSRGEALRRRIAAGHRARALVLAARRGLYEELERTALAAVQELRADPAHQALLARLERAARDELGADAVVEPHPAGGLVARLGPRSLDYSLPALAARCVAALGARVEELWR